MQLVVPRAGLRIGETAVVSQRVNEPQTGNRPRGVGTGVGRTGQERIGQDRAGCRVDPGECAASCCDGLTEQGIGVLPAEYGMDEGLRHDLVGHQVVFRRTLEICLLLHANDRRAELIAQKPVDRVMRIDDRLQARDLRQGRRRGQVGTEGRPDGPGEQDLDLKALDAQSHAPGRPRAPAGVVSPHVSTPLELQAHPGHDVRAWIAATTGPNFTSGVSIGPPASFSPIEPSLRRRSGSRRGGRLCRSQQESRTAPIFHGKVSNESCTAWALGNSRGSPG